MEQASPIPAKAALAPLVLVAIYTVGVALAPPIALADLWRLVTGHLMRNALLVVAAGAIAGCTLIVTNLRSRETRRQLLSVLGTSGSLWSWSQWFAYTMPCFYLALLLASFTSFKQFVLPSAGFSFDAAFAAADRALFMGIDPWRITHWLVPSATGTQMLDYAYMVWFVPMLLFVLLSGAAPARLRTRYLIAFALIWICAGTALAYLLPAAGPCFVQVFHDSGAFMPLTERLAAQSEWLADRSSGTGLMALIGQGQLLHGFQTRELMLAGGISAMPSVHNAVAVLFACAGFACHKVAGWILSLFAAVIWFASIHLGWHYAIDGIAGLACALACWKLAGLWTDRLFETAPEPFLLAPAIPQAAIR